MVDIWHPFTQLRDFEPLGEIVRAQGAWLELADGRRVLDGIASWWVNVHGHAHPAITAAIAEQAAAFHQVILADFTHRPAMELTERLKAVLPGDLDRVFLSDDGSTSVEVALKLAWQAQRATGSERHRFVAFENAYHGDTLGAMSVGARDVFSAPFDPLLLDVDVLPWNDPAAIDRYFAEHGHEVVACIVEPMMQGAGGIRFGSTEMLVRLDRACEAAGALWIADEVATGFGRTGTMFAVEHAGVVPDLLCMSKGLTGGSIALGATAVSERLFQTFLGDDKRTAFLHGHSFSGNPICCAAALASLQLFETEGTLARAAEVASAFAAWAPRFSAVEGVSEVRWLGGVFAFNMEGGPGGYLDPIGRRVQLSALEQGLYVRPLGDVVYLMPPFCLSTPELEGALSTLLQTVVEEAARPVTTDRTVY